jgi:hypothetical protein
LGVNGKMTRTGCSLATTVGFAATTRSVDPNSSKLTRVAQINDTTTSSNMSLFSSRGPMPRKRLFAAFSSGHACAVEPEIVMKHAASKSVVSSSQRYFVISKRETSMRRTALILATVAALGTAVVSAPAEARYGRGWGWGPGIGLGIAAGALTAGAIAASQPYYGPGYGYYGPRYRRAYYGYGYGGGPYAYGPGYGYGPRYYGW